VPGNVTHNPKSSIQAVFETVLDYAKLVQAECVRQHNKVASGELNTPTI
jgi:hypothetical protein